MVRVTLWPQKSRWNEIGECGDEIEGVAVIDAGDDASPRRLCAPRPGGGGSWGAGKEDISMERYTCRREIGGGGEVLGRRGRGSRSSTAVVSRRWRLGLEKWGVIEVEEVPS